MLDPNFDPFAVPVDVLADIVFVAIALVSAVGLAWVFWKR